MMSLIFLNTFDMLILYSVLKIPLSTVFMGLIWSLLFLLTLTSSGFLSDLFCDFLYGDFCSIGILWGLGLKDCPREDLVLLANVWRWLVSQETSKSWIQEFSGHTVNVNLCLKLRSVNVLLVIFREFKESFLLYAKPWLEHTHILYVSFWSADFCLIHSVSVFLRAAIDNFSGTHSQCVHAKSIPQVVQCTFANQHWMILVSLFGHPNDSDLVAHLTWAQFWFSFSPTSLGL